MFKKIFILNLWRSHLWVRLIIFLLVILGLIPISLQITVATERVREILDIKDEEQIESYVSPYGEILEGSEGADRNQLIAECIFETDIISGDYE